MNIFVDTNVILDVLLKRASFYAESFAVVELADKRVINGWISSVSLTDIFYLVRKSKQYDTAGLYSLMDDLTGIFSIASVSEGVIAGALAFRWKDFEDAVQYMAACETKADYIVTRNKADYETATIPCISPAEFLRLLPTS